LIVTDESEVEETISLARSVLTEGKMVLIKSVSKFGVHAQVVGQIRKKVTLLKTNQDPNPSVTYFHHFSNPESALLSTTIGRTHPTLLFWNFDPRLE